MNFILLSFGFFFSGILFAQSVTMHVKLSPMGKFSIQGKSIKGDVRLVGDKYIGKNIVLDLKDLKSGNDLRDQHIQDYFETSKFPTAVLTKGVGKNSEFVAELKIRNITKKISGSYKLEGAQGQASFKTKLSDFGIKSASYMGVGVQDEVLVEVAMPVGK